MKDPAALFDVHVNTLRLAIEAGAILSVPVGRHIRIPRDVAGGDFPAWLANVRPGLVAWPCPRSHGDTPMDVAGLRDRVPVGVGPLALTVITDRMHGCGPVLTRRADAHGPEGQ